MYFGICTFNEVNPLKPSGNYMSQLS